MKPLKEIKLFLKRNYPKFFKKIHNIEIISNYITLHPLKCFKGISILITEGRMGLIKKINKIKKNKKENKSTIIKRIEIFIFNQIYIFKKITKKIFNYIHLYRKDPQKFNIIKSIYNSNNSALFIDKIDSNFKIKETKKQVDIIIPWYGDKNIFSLIPNIFKTDDNHLSNLFIINDYYPNEDTNEKLDKFIKKINNKKIIYIKQSKNKGFVGTVNYGFSLIKNDCIILNSDVLTTKNWIQKILDASEVDQKIATITPLSNNATIFSVPKFLEKNEDNDYVRSNEICENTSTQKIINIPTGHGFCMFFRKKYLDKYGFFDEKTFGKGYGEENDLCMRYKKNGLRNVALLNTYILHLESQSFGDKKRIEQIKNNYPKLLKKHPKYDMIIQNFIRSNPLKINQELMTLFQNNQDILSKENILIITHTNPYKVIGGVEIETSIIIDHIHDNTDKNIILFFFDKDKNQHVLFIIQNGIVIKQIKFKQLIPVETILIWILKAFNIKKTIIEHLMYHSLSYGKIFKDYKIKSILFIHDFYYFCPKADLINNKNIFCKYEKNKNKCEKCLSNKIDITEWRKNSKDLIRNYTNTIIFNSEFTKSKYLELLNIKPNKKFKISYPE